MRVLSAELLGAQGLPDPEVTIAARFKRRGTFASDPLAWRPLFKHASGDMPYGDVGVTSAVCPCAANGAMVRVLRSQSALKVGVQRFNVLTWSGDGSSWSSAAALAMAAAPTDIGTLATAVVGESTPGVARAGSTMRCLFADGGALKLVTSYTDGASWLAPVAVWNGSATYNRISNFSAVVVGSVWYWVFNGYTPGGVSRVLGLSSASYFATWAALPDGGGVGWEVAGLEAGSPYEPEPCLYVYLTGKTGGFSVLACQRVKLNTDGSFNSWDGAPLIVDRAGPSDGVNFARVRLGDAAGAYLFALQEKAVNPYWFVSSLFALPGSLDIEEPVYLEPAGDVATAEYLHPVQCGRRAWLVGSGGIWASARDDEPANLSVRSYTPTAYTYTVQANGGGELLLSFARELSGERAPETFSRAPSPEVYVGDLLWLDRSLTDGNGDGGTMTLAFRVLQVAYTRAGVEVLAADALGVLSHMRGRRAKYLAKDERPRMGDVDALCHWCGLEVTGSGSLPHAVYPSLGFIWPVNDSGLNVMRRYLADEVVALRSAGAESGGQSHTTVEFTALPTESAYTYVSPYGLGEGTGTHEIADWSLALDGRQARLITAVGLATAGDPLGDEGDKGWSIATARPLPGVRPYPLSMTNYNLATSDGTVQDLAAGQAQWLLFGLPIGWIETGANLGVELYDVVTIDETLARVVGVTESYERGRLRQRLDLAEVNSFGVSVG